MPTLAYAESIVIASSPDALYDIVSDVARMGEFSPTCTACWWDDGDGPRPGSWFTGRNETADRVWETRSQVEVADRGRAFSFVVGGSLVRWSYTFAAAGDQTVLTESWAFLPAGLALFAERYGEGSQAEIAERTASAHSGIPVTLGRIKRAAESI